jgi:hypothetical protein
MAANLAEITGSGKDIIGGRLKCDGVGFFRGVGEIRTAEPAKHYQQGKEDGEIAKHAFHPNPLEEYGPLQNFGRSFLIGRPEMID